MRSILWLLTVALLGVGAMAFAQTSPPMIASATGNTVPMPHHSGTVMMHIASTGLIDLDQVRAAQELADVMQFDWVTSVFVPTGVTPSHRTYEPVSRGDNDFARVQAELAESMQVSLEPTTTVFPTDVTPAEEHACDDFDECRVAEELAATIQS